MFQAADPGLLAIPSCLLLQKTGGRGIVLSSRKLQPPRSSSAVTQNTPPRPPAQALGGPSEEPGAEACLALPSSRPGVRLPETALICQDITGPPPPASPSVEVRVDGPRGRFGRAKASFPLK